MQMQPSALYFPSTQLQTPGNTVPVGPGPYATPYTIPLGAASFTPMPHFPVVHGAPQMGYLGDARAFSNPAHMPNVPGSFDLSLPFQSPTEDVTMSNNISK